jgi:transcriptional regulator with XRE-family HTH domain
MKTRMTAKGDRSLSAIGERLRLTREALGLSQAAFARAAKISAPSYNQYEKGVTRPSIDQAIRMRDAHKLTLDWIFLGDNSGLKTALHEAIKALRQARP